MNAKTYLILRVSDTYCGPTSVLVFCYMLGTKTLKLQLRVLKLEDQLALSLQRLGPGTGIQRHSSGPGAALYISESLRKRRRMEGEKKRAADGPETQTESKFGLGDQSLVGSNHSCALRRNPVRRLSRLRKLFVSTT